MALQSNVDFCLINGLLPVSFVVRPLFPICNFAFISICYHHLFFIIFTADFLEDYC